MRDAGHVARACGVRGRRLAHGRDKRDAIADPAVDRFQPAWSTRAHLLAEAGRADAAAEAFRRAIDLTTDQGIVDYLREQLTSLSL